MLALDAFSGDAIPVHLLTVEAFAIYLRHLAPHGDHRGSHLKPALRPASRWWIAIADHDHLATVTIHPMKRRSAAYSSLWVLVTPDPQSLEADAISQAAHDEDDGSRVLWTDDHASLVEVLWRKSFETLWSKTPPLAFRAAQ